MRPDHEHLGGGVLLAAAHTGNALAAAPLDVVGVRRLALDVAEIRHGEDAFLARDQILDIHLAADRRDLGAALVAVFLLDLLRLVLDDPHQAGFVRENVAEIGHLRFDGGQLLLQLQTIGVRQRAERHLHDGLRLRIVQSKALAQTQLCRGAVGAGTDDRDHLVDVVDGDLEALQNVGALLGLFEVELRAARNHVHLEVNVMLEHVAQRQRFRLAVHDCEHDHAERRLHLREAVQLVQHDLRGRVALDGDDDHHAVAVGMIVDVGNALNALFLDEIRDILDQARFVDLIRQLGDDDVIPAVFLLLDLGAGAHGDAAAARRVGGADAGAAHDDAARREVGAFDVLHQLVQPGVRVIDQAAHAVDDLVHVVRGDVRGHADGDTRRAVHEQVREMGGESRRFFQTVVIVRDEIDGFLVDILKHFDGQTAHAALGVTIGSRRVAVDRAEVSVAVDEHIAHGEILRETHESVIDGRVAVRMVTPEHAAHGIRALAVGLAGREVVLVHGIEDSSVHRLEPVAHVGQRALHDDRHGVGQKGFFNFLFQVYVDYSAVFHFFIH